MNQNSAESGRNFNRFGNNFYSVLSWKNVHQIFNKLDLANPGSVWQKFIF